MMSNKEKETSKEKNKNKRRNEEKEVRKEKSHLSIIPPSLLYPL